ncbi:hypothetical protein ACFQ9X_23610 [Catenulispora yoronensis]
MVPDLANPFFPAVLRGMRNAPPAEGRHVLSSTPSRTRRWRPTCSG